MDRQDIDALLIGALYGELLPADEARLAAHLESHPTDRSAFEGLKSARQAVRESRIFEVQLEPPQALSALLLQEAHRRAPREARDGWFQRLVRSFAAHPALAAAAMLAIVLGFAGLMSRHGAGVADQQRAETTTAAVAPAGTSANAATPPAAPEPGAMAGSAGYVVGLADNEDERKAGAAAPAADPSATQQAIAIQRRDANGETRAQAAHHASNVAAPVAKAANVATGGIVVRGEDRQPKDLDGMVAGDEGYAGGGAAATGQRAAKLVAPSDKLASPPPPPPPPAQTASAESQASIAADRPAEAPGAPAPAAHTAAVPGTAWSRAQHTDAIAAVHRGDCAGAATIALAVKQREPAFYDQVMATDRALARCQAYIASELERDLEAHKAAAHVQATDQK